MRQLVMTNRLINFAIGAKKTRGELVKRHLYANQCVTTRSLDSHSGLPHPLIREVVVDDAAHSEVAIHVFGLIEGAIAAT
jgi:hypothetical protein